MVELLPVHQYSVDFFFQILVLQEYWLRSENRIPLRPVLLVMRIVALNISSHETLLFSNFVGSLFLKDLFSRLFRMHKDDRMLRVNTVSTIGPDKGIFNA